MPRKPMPDPEKYCERCGVLLRRKRYGKTLEDMGRFRSRKYCSLRCSNSRGIRSLSSTRQHTISQAKRKQWCERCGEMPERKSLLHVHHINKDWADHSAANLTTLCIVCHLGLHKKEKGVCKVCQEPVKGHGLCMKHYQRWKKYGDPLLTRKVGGHGCEIVRVGPLD